MNNSISMSLVPSSNRSSVTWQIITDQSLNSRDISEACSCLQRSGRIYRTEHRSMAAQIPHIPGGHLEERRLGPQEK